MKKLILGVALASFVISCKKVTAGGNVGVLKMEENADRYSEDEMKGGQTEVKETAVKADSTVAKTDTATVSEMQVAAPKMKAAKVVPATLTSPMIEQK